MHIEEAKRWYAAYQKAEIWLDEFSPKDECLYETVFCLVMAAYIEGKRYAQNYPQSTT